MGGPLHIVLGPYLYLALWLDKARLDERWRSTRPSGAVGRVAQQAAWVGRRRGSVGRVARQAARRD